MSEPPIVVLDSSALLAYLRREPGFEVVRESLFAGAVISAVNWAETLTKLFDLGRDAGAIADRLTHGGIVGQVLTIQVFDEALARETARLRQPTKIAGLSLGDRACLALGRTLRLPVMTGDRSWQSLGLGIEVRPIR
ncbi:MAG: type II toxin-antitoxin system VapC family toxin [Acidobacteria bacterium]|nr:type II toxin-antitoxin system VapC family toxin [Acidobacteriota bacterium]